MIRQLDVTQVPWPLKKHFIIARGRRTEARTLCVKLRRDRHSGRGECVPYARYGESFESVIAQIESVRVDLEKGLTRQTLQSALPAGAARNAVDAALWDLEAKITGQDVGQLSGLGWPENVGTVQTISILSPETMGEEAARLKDFPILKIKLDAEHILERIVAVHRNAPKSKLLVDANESWNIDILHHVATPLARLGVVMIEQPLKADIDEGLREYTGPLPIFADESCHTCEDLFALKGKYTGINIKLDKTGGLTEAISLMNAAKEKGFDVMLGCMLGSSLAMAPAMFLAAQAQYVDLDGPALLAKDYKHGLHIKNGNIAKLSKEFWGA